MRFRHRQYALAALPPQAQWMACTPLALDRLEVDSKETPVKQVTEPQWVAGASARCCFCTLALGEGYAKLALQLAGDIAKYAPDVRLFVLSDHPGILQGMTNVVVRAHTRRSAMGYNDKLCVIAKALQEFETCIFLDADVRILQPVHLEASVFGPGLQACRPLTWAAVRERHSAGEPAHWKREFLRMMQMLRQELKVEVPDSQVPHVQEQVFAVSRGATTNGFLRKWNEVAVLCERKGYFRWEGLTIGAAALLTGMPVVDQAFLGFRFFEPVQSLQDVESGLLSRSAYEALLATVVPFKTSGAFLPRVRRQLAAAFTRLKGRIRGLDLLN